MTIKAPKWPPGQLTTGELRTYRRDLEQAMTQLPATSAQHQVYADRLKAVISEQQARARTTGIPVNWSGS